MGPDAIRSTLRQDGTTDTPTEVMELARRVCVAARRQLRGRKVQAHIVPCQGTQTTKAPFGKPLVGVVMTDEYNARCAVQLSIGGRYNFQVKDEEISYRLIVLPVPDFSEAMHFASLVIHAMNASIKDVGMRFKEGNQEILARALLPDEHGGLMTSCMGRRPTRKLLAMPDESIVVKISGTVTPTKVHDWVCEKVALLSRLDVLPITARMWARRVSRGVEGGSERNFREEFVLHLADSGGHHSMNTFRLRDVGEFRRGEIGVGDFLEALHVTGMILDGCGAKVERIGMRGSEKNEDLLALPLRPDQTHGLRGRASNFVTPLPKK